MREKLCFARDGRLQVVADLEEAVDATSVGAAYGFRGEARDRPRVGPRSADDTASYRLRRDWDREFGRACVGAERVVWRKLLLQCESAWHDTKST